MNIYLEEATKNVRRVSEERNYWFIRTYGGAVYSDFQENGYVGIGFNDVPFEYIENCKPNENDVINLSHYNTLRNYISKEYKISKSSVTKWANQLIDFQHRIKVGDIVISPSSSSELISIGEITGNVKVVKETGTFFHDGKYESLPEKRIGVRWITTKNKFEIRQDVNGLTLTRQAITNVNFYSDFIEGYISNLFVKEDNSFLVLQVDQDKEINAFQMNNFLSCLTYFYQEFCRENGIEEDEELYIKIKVQSKGKMAFKAAVLAGLVGISGIIALSNHQKFKLDMGVFGSLDGESDGFLKSISDFLDSSEERRQKAILFDESIKALKAKNQNSTSENNGGNEVENNGEENDCQDNCDN